MSGVLPDHEIRTRGLVAPLRHEHVQPASVDLYLSDEFRIYPPSDRLIDLADPQTFDDATTPLVAPSLILKPGECVLGSTEEFVALPNDVMARVEGVSSIGRLFLLVHVTAGFIDPGFRGRITLEICNLHHDRPMRIHAGRRICQLSFSRMASPVERPYSGRYQDQAGTTESRLGT